MFYAPYSILQAGFDRKLFIINAAIETKTGKIS